MVNFRSFVDMDHIWSMLEGSGVFRDSGGVALCDNKNVLGKIVIYLTLVGSGQRGVGLSDAGGEVWLGDEELRV